MESTKIVIAYFIYLPIVIGLTIFVSKKLFESGKSFMVEIFRGQENIAIATNKLFEVGFYLVNIGWALVIMKIAYFGYTEEVSSQRVIEILSRKIGGFSIYLGVMLLLNLFLFLRGRKVARQKQLNQQVNMQQQPNFGYQK
ncbi:hypothetical protein U8527_05210 [Kordia algicida OT-1]|uniref:Putative integral membrane protein n=1 Tax=Kordia algicida OT-1 TaxID=391587 RepID=A9DMJ3_9FLAO|nr:hypothetical protein [Kordia algicida]EDP97720.1 putative integral membrane protein [Kordia algicida OT-1]